MAKRIFIGSSSEARNVASLLQTEIEAVLGTGSVLPWDDSFEQGVITLAAIEDLPNKVVGALLLATPDVECKRGARSPSKEAVSNVVFEHGYLSARLGSRRVAICHFENVTLPTDLAGLTTIMAGPYSPLNPPPLSDRPRKELRDWLNGLPPLAEGIPPMSRVHGYSGTWDVETRFAKFRGVDLDKSNDDVYFKGRMSLFLSADGKGTGIQQGKTTVSVGEYKTIFTTESRLDAEMDERGVLKLTVYVLSSVRGQESGEPRDPRLRDPLPGHKQFPVTLKPGVEPRTLIGEHEYTPGLRELQKAPEEKYTYLGSYYDLRRE